MAESKIKIPIFKGEKFSTWKTIVYAVLKAKNWFIVLENDGSGIADAARLTAYREVDAKVLGILLTSIDFDIVDKVATCSTSFECWKRLESYYDQNSECQLDMLREQLYSYRKLEKDDMSTHISKIEALCNKLESLGEPMNERIKVSRIVNTLGDKYRNFISSWHNDQKILRTMNELSPRLLLEESLYNINHSHRNPRSEALPASSKRPTNFRKPNYGVNNYNNNSQQPSQQKPSKNDSPSSSSNNKARYPCGYCKKRGHWISECRKRMYNESKKQNPGGTNKANNDESVALTAIACLSNSGSQFIIDSGATDHMSCERSYFKSLRYLDSPIAVTVGGNKIIWATGIGEIHCVRSETSTSKFILKDVLFVPELCANLFSVSSAESKGSEISFKDGTCYVYKEEMK